MANALAVLGAIMRLEAWAEVSMLPLSWRLPEMVAEFKVPTLVSEDAVTLPARVVPVKVPAAAVTVMSAVPLKLTPLMSLAFCKAVAVEALPVRAPANVVVVKVLVLGLKVRPLPRLTPWLVVLPVWAKRGKKVALVLVKVVVTFEAVVAVVEVSALPKREPVTLPVRFPEKVVVVKVLVLGLKERPVPTLSPW